MNTENNTIAVCSIISIITAIKAKSKKRKQKIKRNRAVWSQKWLLRRDSGQGFASMVLNELRLEDPKAFHNFCRMSYKSFCELLEKVSPFISKQNTEMREAISPSARLLLTLRFLATGEKFLQLSYGFRISASSIGIIIPETIDAIYKTLRDDFLKVPQNENEWKKIADEFERKRNFPFCLGAIDGKHIAIRSRKEYGSFYYNYKGFHSVILLAIVDSNYNFLLSRARRVVENAFGILANKFQIFQREIDLSVEKVEKLTLAACALNNFIRTRDGIDASFLDSENTNSISAKIQFLNSKRASQIKTN